MKSFIPSSSKTYLCSLLRF